MFLKAKQREDVEDAFATLERQLEEAKRRENMQVILRVVGGMIKGQLNQGFRTWQDGVRMHKHLFAKRRSAAELIDRVLGRITHATLTRGWNKWKESCAACRATQSRRQIALKTMKRTVRQWEHKRLARGFRRWWTWYVVAQRDPNERKKWALRHLQATSRRAHHASIAAGAVHVSFRLWHLHAKFDETKRVHRDSIARIRGDMKAQRDRIVSRFFRRWLRRPLSRGFRKWRDSVIEWNTDDREKVFNHQLSILEERLIAQRQHQAFQVIGRAVRHWHRQRIGTAFNTLKDLVHARKAQDLGVKHMRNIFARWKHQRKSRGFYAWRDFARNFDVKKKYESACEKLRRQLEEAKRRENMQVILRVVGGMIKGQLSQGFRTWQDGVRMHKHLFAKRRSAAELIDRVLGRITHAALTRGWNQWKDATRKLSEHARLDAMRRDRARRAIATAVRHWTHRKLSRGFEGWIAMCEASRRAETVVERIIRRLLHGKCAAAMDRWHAFLKAQERAKSENALASLQQQLEEAKRRENMQVILRVVGGMIKGQLSQGFRTWQDGVRMH
eukprot:g3330.t1